MKPARWKTKNRGKLTLMEKAYESFPKNDPSPVKDADDFQDYLLKNTFVSCWHKNIDENMVMWEIYGRDSNAVAVQTTIGRISESIDSSRLSGHSLLLKPVVYERSEDVQGVLRYEECFFRKRPHFAFEEEVRIALDTYLPAIATKNTPYGYVLPTCINDLIESIYVHPDSPEWFVGVVNSITNRYAVQAEVKRGARSGSISLDRMFSSLSGALRWSAYAAVCRVGRLSKYTPSGV